MCFLTIFALFDTMGTSMDMIHFCQNAHAYPWGDSCFRLANRLQDIELPLGTLLCPSLSKPLLKRGSACEGRFLF
jgi:hypothetical protein